MLTLRTMNRLVFGFVVLLMVVSLSRTSPPIRGFISPKTPSAFAGRRLSLSCTLVGNITNDISSRDIVFESTNDDVMSKAVKRVIDDRTVSLDIWRAYLNMSSSRISCNLGNLTLDEVAIVVEEPRFPNFTDCIVYNWESMSCTWEWEETDSISMLMAFSRGSRCHNSMTKYVCPELIQEKGLGRCSWHPVQTQNMFLFIDHCVWFSATNAYNATAFSIVRSVVVDRIVKPNQVTVRPVEVATEHIVMNWTFPKEHRALRYRVAYESRSSNAIQTTTDKWITLSNLLPNTTYTIIVDCIPLVRGIATGFWSDKSIVEVTTEPDENAHRFSHVAIPKAEPVKGRRISLGSS